MTKMKKFALRISLFLFTLTILIVIGFKAYYYFTTPRGEKAAYIWGDSQMMNGLDLEYLNANTGYHFYTAAQHGAGVYDLLVFSELVPDNANVFIQISRPVLLRAKQRDRNISALDFSALKQLKANHFTSWELYGIFKKNLFPHPVFIDTNEFYPTQDTMTIVEPLSTFKTLFAKKQSYIDDKERLYHLAMDNLIKKHCKIIAITFPFHSLLGKIEQESPIYNYLQGFDSSMQVYFPHKQNIELKADKNLFYDLSHLNMMGARMLSHEISGKLNFKTTPLLFVVSTMNQK